MMLYITNYYCKITYSPMDLMIFFDVVVDPVGEKTRQEFGNFQDEITELQWFAEQQLEVTVCGGKDFNPPRVLVRSRSINFEPSEIVETREHLIYKTKDNLERNVTLTYVVFKSRKQLVWFYNRNFRLRSESTQNKHRTLGITECIVHNFKIEIMILVIIIDRCLSLCKFAPLSQTQ